jgi:drug/metabolite transporter (DMT)-like permease
MLKGVSLKLASAFSFSLMSLMVKLQAGAYPIAQLVFFRSLFAMGVLIFWLAVRGEFPRALATRRPFGHLLRSVIGSCGMFFGFLALSLLPLADATAFSFAAPLMTVALAALFLGEEVRVYRWTAVAVGLVGVLVMLWDHLDLAGATSDKTGAIGVASALGGATAAALATIQTRRLVATEQTGAIVFYFSLMTTILSALAMATAALWRPEWPGAAFWATQVWVPPSFSGFWGMVAIGVLGGAGQILMTQSFRYADASIIACFDYTSMIFAVALARLVFGETPSAPIVVGALIVAGAGLFVIWRERQLGVIAKQGREAGPTRQV